MIENGKKKKKYGSLIVYCGPMFAGKTSGLLSQAIRAIDQKKTIAAFKPTIDTRYKITDITTHNGISYETITGGLKVHLVKPKGESILESFTSDLYALPELVLIDEAQFLDGAVEDVKTLLNKGVDVVCAGLDLDSFGDSFSVMAELLSLADKVHKEVAICAVCSEEATRTFRKLPNLSDKVAIGGSEMYEPRCAYHWKLGLDELKAWKQS